MAETPSNPYNWQKHTARVEVRREQVTPLVEAMLHGAGAWALGGRGMGKSILLKQVEEELKRRGDTHVKRSPEPW